jgi:tetratricopeptide (TPR) repeat protein
MDDFNGAISILEELMTDNKNLAASYNLFGVIQYYNKDPLKAIKAFTSAIGFHPSFANNYYCRGVVHLSNVDLKEAFIDFDTAIKMENNQAESYLGKSIIHCFSKEYDQSIRCATIAIQIERKWAKAYYIRGLSRYKLGELEKALKDFQKTHALDPEHQITIICLGNCWLRKGNYANALDYFNQVNPSDPDYCYAVNNRGVVNYNLDDLHSSKNDFTLAKKFNPDLLIPLINLKIVEKNPISENSLDQDSNNKNQIKLPGIELFFSELEDHPFDDHSEMIIYDNLIDMYIRI